MEILWQVFFKVSAYVNSPVFLRSFFDNRFYLILLVIVLMRFKYTTYRSMWMSAFNARPVNFTIFPQRGPEGDYVMGSVGFSNITFYNAVPSAMAPLLLLPIAFYLNRYGLPLMRPTFFNYVLYVLLQTIIIENAIPSGADFRVARMYLSGVLLYTVLGMALLLML